MYVLGSKEPCKEWGSGWLIHTVDTGPEEKKTGRMEEGRKGRVEGGREGGRRKGRKKEWKV